MDINSIQAMTADDMQAVNNLMYEQLKSDVALVNQLGLYIVNSGGKRIRPMLSLLAARALGYEGQMHIRLAAIVEFIHTATLLHDDVVDESLLRRGNPTANAEFGNAASVLVGDFIYTRAFQLMVGFNKMQIMEVFADATNVIAEGEVLQLMNCNDPDTTEQSYMQVIYSKTAKLFEAATQLAAIMTEQDQQTERNMQLYGMHLGTAFQLIDDVLDYSANQAELGKSIGDDLAEGKPTLPLILAMKNGTAEQAELIRAAIEKREERDYLADVMAILTQTNALALTVERAKEEANKAIEYLADIPESVYKQALISLARLSVERSF